MKKLMVATTLIAGSSQAHEGHFGDIPGHIHGVEGLLLLTAFIVVTGLVVAFKK